MTINSDIRDQAYRFFLEEAPELLQTIESGILTLRQTRDVAIVHSIMRAAHSLKGGAASVELDAIKAIAHRLETIFKALYSDSLELNSGLEGQLLQAFDCLRVPLMDQLIDGSFDAEQALATAEPIFSKLEEQYQSAIAETENFLPSSSDFGINMATSIFDIDVGQGLERLTTVLANPQTYEVAGELRAQVEVFLGFAELLSLPGFARIAQTTIQALEVNSDRALEILEVALHDFQAGRAAVLAGDDSEGGSPSTVLLALAEPDQEPTPDLTLDRDRNQEIQIEAIETTAIEIITPADMAMLLEQLGDSPEAMLAFSELSLIQDEMEAVEDEMEAVEDEIATDLAISDLAISGLSISDLASSQLEDIFGGLGTSLDVTIEQPLAIATADGFQQTDFSSDTVSNIDYELESDTVSNVDYELEQESQLSLDALSVDISNELEQELESSVDRLSVDPSNELKQDSELSVDALQVTAYSDSNHIETAPTASKTPNRRSPSAKSTRRSAAPKLTLRVDAERLSRINNLLGELTINRNGLSLQNNQLRSAIRELLHRFERVQSTVQQLRATSDQLLVSPERHGAGISLVSNGQRSGNQPIESIMRQTDFDSLEMDNYTAIYSYTQTLLEEMVQLEEAVEDMSLFNRQSDQMLGQHRKMLSQMQDELMWARMIPLDEMLSRFPRILRDLSNTYQKPVNLTLSGTDLLMDKAVLDRLSNPLLHLLRNAFDHGIEPATVRYAQGKPEDGQIEIRASYAGRQVVIEVRDDGRGIDLNLIRRRVVELGWLSVEEVNAIADAQLYEFIFEPGFSTASQVSDLSGRGVGLDVVRDQLRSLKGKVTVQSIPGEGATFILTLPLTLTIVNLLVCFVGSTPIALRSDGITEIMIPKPEQLRQVGSQRILKWQGQDVPAYRLSDVLTYACVIPEIPPSQVLAVVPSPADWETPILILKRKQHTVALQVERLVTDQESVVKPFGTAIAPPSYAYGCTVLGDGRLIPVIDGLAFLDTLMDCGLAATPTSNATNAFLTDSVQEAIAGSPVTPNIRISEATTILVVDDAVTSRRMLTLSLERAGYRVLQARDGQEALEQLQQSQSIKLVVCDIEMPTMNGFEFLTQRRQNPDLAPIPTVMLTSRSNDKHRWLAMQLGATDYFTKPYLEQEFLHAIAQHLNAQTQPNT
jgi:chemotaxis family two-component system sensor histidine kinase/response regulator PixL